jgi:hypothetical protein
MSHAKQTSTRNTALHPEPVKPEITLGDEEVSDVSLATFHVLDKENAAEGQRLSRKNPGGGCGCAQGYGGWTLRIAANIASLLSASFGRITTAQIFWEIDRAIPFPGPLRLAHQSSCDCRNAHKDDEELEGQGEAGIWFDLVNRQEQYGGNDADAEDVNEGQHSTRCDSIGRAGQAPIYTDVYLE